MQVLKTLLIQNVTYVFFFYLSHGFITFFGLQKLTVIIFVWCHIVDYKLLLYRKLFFNLLFLCNIFFVIYLLFYNECGPFDK